MHSVRPLTPSSKFAAIEVVCEPLSVHLNILFTSSDLKRIYVSRVSARAIIPAFSSCCLAKFVANAATLQCIQNRGDVPIDRSAKVTRGPTEACLIPDFARAMVSLLQRSQATQAYCKHNGNRLLSSQLAEDKTFCWSLTSIRCFMDTTQNTAALKAACPKCQQIIGMPRHS